MASFVLLYCAAVYVTFLAAFVYLVLFIGGAAIPWLAVAKTVDVGPAAALGAPAALVNLALLALFGVQHSIMARAEFKRALTRFVPEPAERSTFVLATVVCLALLYAYWVPMPGAVWSVDSPLFAGLLTSLFFAGAGIVLVSTFLIDHFELFGLRQGWAHFRGEPLPVARFRTPALYRIVRHPIYLGMLLVFWATPEMSVGHLLLAGVWTTYMLIGVGYEERDLLRTFGEAYRAYIDAIPTILPFGRRSGRS